MPAQRRGLCWTHEFSQRYQTNPLFRENRKKTKRDYNRWLLQEYRDRIAGVLGGWKCVMCGTTLRDVLAFDHKNGDGEEERNRMGGQLPTIRYYYHHLRDARKRLQVLCANCNWKKVTLKSYGKSTSKTSVWVRMAREDIIGLLGGPRCRECGMTDSTVLTIDHVNGGGAEERRRMGGYQAVLHFYLNHPGEAREKLQVLCRNCNWKRHLSGSTLANMRL